MPDEVHTLDAAAPTIVEAPPAESHPSAAPPEETHPEVPSTPPEQAREPEPTPEVPAEQPATAAVQVETPVPEPAEPAEPAAPEAAAAPAEEEPAAAAAEEPAAAEPAPPPPENKKKWYVVKVQSGREDSIKEAIERRVKIEGLEECFGQIIIPVEVVTEMRNGRRVKKEHKLYPGYLMVEVEYNNNILYLFRETSGVGDFVGHTVKPNGEQRPPTPMTDREVERMLHKVNTKTEEHTPTRTTVTAPKFDRGDRLRVTEGTFATMEGEVLEINQEKGQVKLQLTIFGRPVMVELEYWQVEKV